MDVTIAGAQLLEQNKAKEGASINIKNNKQQADTIYGAKSFQNVLISGMQVNQKKLDENTYNSLLKEADDVKSQIMQSAQGAKANLKALFNRLSGADLVKIDEDGFHLNDLSPEEMVGIVDKIKIELAAHGKDVYFANGTVSAEQIEAVVGSTAMADKVAQQLNESHLPATQDNLEQIAGGLKKLNELTDLSENAKYYLIANNSEPTLDNIYKAQHMVSASGDAAAKGKVTVTEDEWQQLMPQAADVIQRAGLPADGKQLTEARKLLEADIPITKENMQYKSQLDALVVTDLQSDDGVDSVLKQMIQSLEEGISVGDTVLLAATSVYTEVSTAMDVLWHADIRHVAEVTKSGETFNIDNLADAVNSIEAASYRFQFQVTAVVNEDPVLEEDTSVRQATQSNYEQLQQIRILMTADAGLFLARQGVNLHAEPISHLVQQLYDYHAAHAQMDDVYKKTDIALEQQGVQAPDNTFVQTNASIGEMVSSFQAVMQVKRAIYEIKHAPDVSMGAVMKEKAADEALTIADFADKGSTFRQKYEQAGQSYEAVGTEVRKDLGDSLESAVENSYADILEDLGLEKVQANMDAVRIFAQNQMEITRERIENIKEIHTTLKSIINNMKPETALAMIRENINPMTADIHDVNAYLLDKNEDMDSDVHEKYSQFLYKLDMTDGISAKEREQFIGIYKMMNIFTKDAGAAIGTLLKQNEEITMENLCKAYNSRKAAGLDYTITDEAEIPEFSKRAGYFNNLFDATAKHITPLSLKTVNDSEPIDNRTVENFCEDIDVAYDEAEEAKYYEKYLADLNMQNRVEDSVVRELTYADQKVTVNNVLAMENIMQTGYFDKVFGNENGLFSQERAEQLVQQLDQPQQLAEAYTALEEDAKTILETAVASDDAQTYENINELRMRYKEMSVIKVLSDRHDYKIPMVTKDGVGMIHLTLIQDAKEKGRISIHFAHKNAGNVSLEAKVTEKKAEVYGICDKDTTTLQNLLEHAGETLKREQEFEEVSVHCQDLRTVRRVTYDAAGASVASEQLYAVAKTLIYAMQA